MQHMIKAYETSRTSIQRRIRELTAALRDDTLMHRDRERLMQRRDLLTAESIEMLHIITDLRRHCA